jgi:hypothetical protein
LVSGGICGKATFPDSSCGIFRNAGKSGFRWFYAVAAFAQLQIQTDHLACRAGQLPSRSISIEGLLNGKGDLSDNIRMLGSTGAKYIGRSICLWGGESMLLANFERAKQQLPQVHAVDTDMVLEACIFEIVTREAEQVPVPDWAFIAMGFPVEKRNFNYEAILYPLAQRKRSWGKDAGVPDVSQTETQLWFYFLAKSYIDLGFEGIHWG